MKIRSLTRLVAALLFIALIIGLCGCGVHIAKPGEAQELTEKDANKEALEALEARKATLDAYYNKFDESYTLLHSAADEIVEKIDKNLSIWGTRENNYWYLEAKGTLSAGTVDRIEALYRELPALAETASADPDYGDDVTTAQKALEDYYQLVMNYTGQDGNFSRDLKLNISAISSLNNLSRDLSFLSFDILNFYH